MVDHAFGRWSDRWSTKSPLVQHVPAKCPVAVPARPRVTGTSDTSEVHLKEPIIGLLDPEDPHGWAGYDTCTAEYS